MEGECLLFYYGATILTYSLLGLSVLFGFLKYPLFNNEQKWYLSYLVFIFIIEMTTNLLIEFRKQNMLAYPFYISGEFFILAGMFIVGIKLPRKLLFIIGAISALLFLESFSFWYHHQNITSGYGKAISHLIIICMSGYYLIRALKIFEFNKQNKFLFIYCTLFLYYSVSLFLFLLMNQLTTTSINNASIVWGINNILSSVLYGVSFYTFVRLKRSR
jgi:hypothetical protein